MTGFPGPAAAPLLELFLQDRDALARRQAEADRLIDSSSAAHLVHEVAAAARNRPWRLDPIPLLLPAATFDRLADAVAARIRGMEALLADLYGPRQLVRDGVVPAEALSSSRRYRIGRVGVPLPPRWLTTYALDVVELTDGSWRVVRDLADTPTGIGYALLDRSVMGRVAAEVLGPGGTEDLASIGDFLVELRHALASVATTPSPRIVVFSSGVDDPGYVEHSALASQLGFNLVEAPDLVVRQGRLWLRTLGGLDPVDVVYRRVADHRVDPIEVAATGAGGVPGLLAAADEGGVILANAHGAGAIEDPTLLPYWPAALEALAAGGAVLRALAPEDELAQHPTFGSGAVGTATVVVRLHAVVGDGGVTVMPGGNGRVLAAGDRAGRPTARLAKDVWVVGERRPTPVLVAPALAQVDFVASVPTRAAHALFWFGRAAERAEALARLARVVAARRQQDPRLVVADDGRWAQHMTAVLRALREESSDTDPRTAPDAVPPVAVRPVAALDQQLAEITRAIGLQISGVIGEAATVMEYLPTTTSRVLGQLTRLRATYGGGWAPLDTHDAAIAGLATLAGLWAENTVRGPAWRMGDIGRRLERSLVVLAFVDACTADDAGTDQLRLEVLLAGNDSLAAYRRRYRSDIELSLALDLLLRDGDNPRSLAFSLHQLGDHARSLGWDEGAELVERVHALGVVDGDVRAAAATVQELSRSAVEHWFATPVDPVVVHGAEHR